MEDRDNKLVINLKNMTEDESVKMLTEIKRMISEKVPNATIHRVKTLKLNPGNSATYEEIQRVDGLEIGDYVYVKKLRTEVFKEYN